MTRSAKTALAIGGALLGGGAIAGIAGARRWDRETRNLSERLLAAADTGAACFTRALLDGLPEPVTRYFRFALRPGQPLIRSAVLEQQGHFRLGGPESPWLPLSARQTFSARPAGFVWDAAIRMGPGATVRVRDAYLVGAGRMQGRLLGLFPVVDQRDTPELNAGALQRYLAEAPWFPTALLPRDGLTWEGLDDHRARATLTDHGITVSLEFTFGAQGELVRSYTPARFRAAGAGYVATPWGGEYRDYGVIDGMQVPHAAEVSWHLPEGPLPYARLQVSSVEYRFAR